MIPDRPPQQKIFGLDAMRVLAIFLVLSAHCLWIFSEHKNLFTKGVSFFGFMGVEVFFVLSGYLIGGSLYRSFLDSDFSFGKMRRFLKRRSMRIMPPYLLILILNIIVATSLRLPVPKPWKYVVFLQNFYHPMLPFFPESWSMAIKEIPYFLIPFLLLAVAALTRGLSRAKVFGWLVFLLWLSGLLNKVQFHLHHPELNAHTWNVSLRSVFLYRYDAVLTGVLFYWLQMRFPNLWRERKMLWLVLGMLLFGLMAFFTGIAKWSVLHYPMFWNLLLLPCLSLASALWLPFFSGWQNASRLLDKPVTWLGDVSYMIYLTHYSLILWPMKILFPTSQLSMTELVVYLLVYLSAVFGLSTLLHNYFERPFLRWRMNVTAYGKG